MPNYKCKICNKPFSELGQSPYCENCKRFMCPECEKKHDKEQCKEFLLDR